MFTHLRILTVAWASALASAAAPALADTLRNVKPGEPLPAFRMPLIDGSILDSEALRGSTTVIVCLSAEQRRSELAAMDSAAVVAETAPNPVQLVHVTADAVQKPYFERFRTDRGISAPLAFDAEHEFFGRIGLIVFPTTIVIDKEGRLSHVLSLHGGEYKRSLDAYIRHTLGEITDAQLEERLSAKSSETASPKSAASAHRGLARSLREKGRFDAAKAELTKALEQDPSNREVMLDLADLAITMNDLDGADATIDRMLADQPDDRRAKELKGIVLFSRGKVDDAEKALTESLNLNPSPERAHYYLGRIAEEKGDAPSALKHYREALRRFIKEPEANKP